MHMAWQISFYSLFVGIFIINIIIAPNIYNEVLPLSNVNNQFKNWLLQK